MKKMRLLCLCFIILVIALLLGCNEILDPIPPSDPTPIPQYEVGKYGESRFGAAVFGTENSKTINNVKKEN